MSYCVSLGAKSQLAAFAWVAGGNAVGFLLCVMTFVVSPPHSFFSFMPAPLSFSGSTQNRES